LSSPTKRRWRRRSTRSSPGQGRADELWISAATLAPLRATLREGPFSRLQATYRSDIEHRLRTAPVARGVLGTLIAAASLAALLAALGLLVSLLGQARDEVAERDLVAVGVGPRGLRRELRARMLLAAVLGVAVGLGVAASLTRLAVATVRAAGSIADPQPPLVAVAPWAQLALWSLAALCALALALGGHPVAAAGETGGPSSPVPAAVEAPGLRPPVLSLREVFCVHRTPDGDAAALQGATLEAQAGELICVLGPSGAGKSTLLRVIAGLQTPSAGDVLVLGRDIGRLPPRSRAQLRHELFGFLGQCAAATLSPDLRVQDCVALPLSLRGVQRAERRARVTELLERVGLGGRARAWPAELSGGERQRVAFCVAIAHRPRLLLADEPTGELDADSALAVRQLIADVTRGTGATTILVSHDPANAAVADRTLVIRDGRVAEDADPIERTLVVAPDGLVRLPPELLAQASIAGRARVAGDADGLVVSRTHAASIAGASGAGAKGGAGTGSGPGRGGRAGTGGGATAAPAEGLSGSLERVWGPAEVQLRSAVRGVGLGQGDAACWTASPTSSRRDGSRR
jgi:putative ABC transport system ATP-binding protein